MLQIRKRASEPSDDWTRWRRWWLWIINLQRTVDFTAQTTRRRQRAETDALEITVDTSLKIVFIIFLRKRPIWSDAYRTLFENTHTRAHAHVHANVYVVVVHFEVGVCSYKSALVKTNTSSWCGGFYFNTEPDIKRCSVEDETKINFTIVFSCSFEQNKNDYSNVSKPTELSLFFTIISPELNLT